MTMTSNIKLELVEFSRDTLLRVLSNLTEEESRIVPNGCPNSILWNAGHILLSVEQFLFVGTGRENSLPAEFMRLFWRGTRPSDWSMDVPTFFTIKSLITAQTERVKKHFIGRLDDQLQKPMEFPGMQPLRNIGELLSMLLFHEGLHVGYIKAIKATLPRQG